jgi:phosphopantothenoylcysteine decarboxylase/phosphopantothenate--cysteine ligase
VILVAGPHLTVSHSLIQVVSRFGAEMYEACHQYFDEKVDVACRCRIDYKPKIVAKIKADDNFGLNSKRQKIFASLGKIKKNQFLIGFALETENEIENAKVKSRKKLRFDCFKFFTDHGRLEITNKVTLYRILILNRWN